MVIFLLGGNVLLQLIDATCYAFKLLGVSYESAILV